MKRLFLSLALVVTVLGASAEITFLSLDNKNGTNIVLQDTSAPDKVEITKAVFQDCGREYHANGIRCDVADGKATYRLKFKKLTTFKDCKVTVTVNGKTETVEIQKHLLAR